MLSPLPTLQLNPFWRRPFASHILFQVKEVGSAWTIKISSSSLIDRFANSISILAPPSKLEREYLEADEHKT
ncbi:hypothetical protein V6Z12_D12G091000 [Gossypium hirsutum]